MAPAAEHPRGLKHPDDSLILFGDLARARDGHIPDSAVPTLSEIKALIPPHCFRPSLSRSLYYVFRDFFFLFVIYYAAYATYGTRFHLPFLPIFWFFAGFFMWAVFVLGHDCGHGSFSRNKNINSIFGHILHSLILVPFHSWRISHRKHHKNTGNYEKDEIFYPMPQSEYSGVHPVARVVYRDLYFLAIFAYPIYLVKGYGNVMKNGSHFSPYSELFTKEERPLVKTSLACWSTMVLFLIGCAFRFGFTNVLIYYMVPYLIFCTWLLVVTFLHHTEPGSRWYNTESWSYVRGNLESIDRVYGFLEHFHHDIGTHVVHHIFPAIPHYHLREASESIKPFLGRLHKVESKSPMQQLPESFRAWQASHVIPDATDVFVIPKA